MRADDTRTATKSWAWPCNWPQPNRTTPRFLDRLSKLVDVEDPATGRVKPKAKVEEVDVMIARVQIGAHRTHGPMTLTCPAGHASETAEITAARAGPPSTRRNPPTRLPGTRRRGRSTCPSDAKPCP